MELIDQKTKKIMEGCKERALDSGLRFQDETLEYVVTNRDLLELSPKYMIPTLYDYWVHDVEVLKGKGKYELYPHNPYETVINTRPAISFYNDNNPDWLNVMIFYHVLGHVDFFQNNVYFRNTWDYDFTGRALADKRLIAKLRSEKGRWVDYVIEFARGIDNIVGYHDELSRFDNPAKHPAEATVDFYFDVFLQKVRKVSISEYMKELERYNAAKRANEKTANEIFFASVRTKHPEFDPMLEKYLSSRRESHRDVLQFVMRHSGFLAREENRWMKSIMEIVRSTSLFFQPQIRTKIMNEGWASYWHERLFLTDDRIEGHEIDFARTHAGVASLPRVGLNPYALGIRLFQYIETLGDTGRNSMAYRLLRDAHERKHYDTRAGKGSRLAYDVRTNLSDYLFIETFVDQDFMDKFNLFVAGRRLNQDRMVWEYYVKSRRVEDYKQMLQTEMYHPPHITVDVDGSGKDNTLNLVHHFEGKPLVADYVANTMLGVEFLWGAPVELETHEVVSVKEKKNDQGKRVEGEEPEVKWRKVKFRMKDKKLTKMEL